MRLAFNYAFDFEEMNRQIFFNQYNRIASYFAGTELAAAGLAAGGELELLEAVREQQFLLAPSPSPMRIPSTEILRRYVTICARLCGSSKRLVTRCATSNW